MINKSIWLKGVRTKKENILKENIETDILIIGGGMTGITTAYFLKDKNMKVTLVEQNTVASGQSSKTTGKLTYLQGTILDKIKNIYDVETTLKYIESQREAIEIVKDIIIQNNIKCDFESNNSYIFSNRKTNIDKINNIKEILNSGNYKYKIASRIPIDFSSKLSLKVDDTAVFNPVKYLLEIKEIIKDKINIYENTRILEIKSSDDYYIAYTTKNTIKAKKIVFACHYPFFLFPYLFPFRTSIKKGYLCASQIESTKRFNAINEDDTVHSIRYHSDNKNYIIYSSEERNLGKNINDPKNYNNLFWKMKTKLSENIKYYWFNTDIVTTDNLPIIGFLEEDSKNLLIGTGYNLWGMTNGTIAGKILSDLILGKKNKYEELFNPNRNFNINKLKNYVSYNFSNSFSFLKSKLNKKQPFYKNVEIIEKNNKKYGKYTDEDGKSYIVSNTCPHMKCSLIFNMTDKTWDCPCHSSRFDLNGKPIKGPSVYSISVDKNEF